MYENKILFYSVCFLLIVVNFFVLGYSPEPQTTRWRAPRATVPPKLYHHWRFSAWIYIQISCKCAFYLSFNCSNLVQWDLITKVYITLHYSITNPYFTSNLLIPYINSLIKRRTLKSVKLIHYMKLISLLLLHNWTSWRVLPMMIWRCLSGWCFCCVSRWPYESSVWRPSLQMLVGCKNELERVTNMTNTN